MGNKIRVHVIHYSKLIHRRKYFSEIVDRNVQFIFVTEEEVDLSMCRIKANGTKLDESYKVISAIYLGHLSNIIRSRTIAAIFLYAISVLLRIGKRIFGEDFYLYQRLLTGVEFNEKFQQINLMHAEALLKASQESEICVILEDDSIFEVSKFVDKVFHLQKYIGANPDSIVFFTRPSAKISTVLEDYIQIGQEFIRTFPPISKGAGAYILHKNLALALSSYIHMSNLALPIDLLINYWAQENKIKIFWQKHPFVIEGSGGIYKSSLR